MSKCADLVIESVSKSFGDLRILRDVSLRVESGSFATLLGPSGCGKTTLLRILAGFETADQGRLVLGGKDLGTLPASRRPVNMVFQSYALFPHLDVFENVAFGLRSRGVAEDEIQRRVAEHLSMMQLEKFARRRPDQLSGGQRQRVALARALVNEPELLLLDEPMSALDAKLRAEVQVELRRLQRKLRTTFLLVTHDQDEAMTVSDVIFLMREGRIAQFGSPEEIYQRPRNRFVAEFLGAANVIPGTRCGLDRVQTALGELVLPRELEWEEGALAIRPERIRLATQAPAQNGLRVELKERVYRGDHLDLFVEPGSLRLRVPATQELPESGWFWIELPPESLAVLDD